MTHGPRYLTVDGKADTYEVSNLMDQFGRPTLDPQLASTCIVRATDGQWIEFDADDIPIYTVH